MTEDIALVAIAVLLPLTAYMTVAQVNPYHALVIRGIMGAVAALVYASFGAADVALTEALVGTMLSITLYAVAVRSSMTMRLGILETDVPRKPKRPTSSAPASDLDRAVAAIRTALSPHHVRLEITTYSSPQSLQTALIDREIHGTCVAIAATHSPHTHHFKTRVRRLHDIIQPEIPETVRLTHVDVALLARVEPQAAPLENAPTSGDPA